MREETKRVLENRLNIVNERIFKNEEHIMGGLYAFGVGALGMAYGVLSKSDSSFVSGMIVSSGSLLFRCFYQRQNYYLRDTQYYLRYALKHPEIVKEYSSDEEYQGKHFKK